MFAPGILCTRRQNDEEKRKEEEEIGLQKEDPYQWRITAPEVPP